MSYSDFYKLKVTEKNSKRIHTIPEGRKVPFEAMGTIDPEDVLKAVKFSHDMAYGEGYQKSKREGGSHERTPNEIFINDIQGKLAEYAVTYCLNEYGFEATEPDLAVYGKNEWDSVDIDCNGKHISIKSTKGFGQLLLLEQKDWDETGRYIPNIKIPNKIAEYDYHILVRISPSCEELLRARKLFYGTEIPEDVIEMLKKQKWTYSMPRFITREELITLIEKNFVLKAGEYFNKTKMDATNYYVKAYDMHKLFEIKDKL